MSSCRGGVVSQEQVERMKRAFLSWNLADAPQVCSSFLRQEQELHEREGETMHARGVGSDNIRHSEGMGNDSRVGEDIPYASAVSFHHQESIMRIRNHHRKNIPTSLAYRKKELLKRYIVEEEDARFLSREIDCPPCELLRCFVEDIIERICAQIQADEKGKDQITRSQETESLSDRLKKSSKLLLSGPKKCTSKVMREPTLLLRIISIINDAPVTDNENIDVGRYEIILSNRPISIPFTDFVPRLVEDIVFHTCHDAVHSSLLDETRREVGDEFEENLAYCLESAGIPFAREDELRKKGQAKTPDFQLHVPIFVSGKCIHWIESKASFADMRTFKDQVENQLNMYKNRFGPGIVIYWFGYEEGVGTSEVQYAQACGHMIAQSSHLIHVQEIYLF